MICKVETEKGMRFWHIHKWIKIAGNEKIKYQRCNKCMSRRILADNDYKPVDFDWVIAVEK